ncbi:MAG TPA: hypothetical protein VGT05_01575 [Patescibacteria group bacterium]|nr:hypothetical protein [Patescibacteria group bacterium]
MKNEICQSLIARFAAIVLVIIGISLKQNGIYFFLASGILLGAYYGWFNDLIWKPNGKLEKSFSYRAHQIWIHIICGTVGSIALYFLLGIIDFSHRSQTLGKLGLVEFILFILAILGYTGLLPRILWFFTYAQQNFK